MRTPELLPALVLVGVASAGACKWTEFDTLRDDAWVKATTKPDGSKSTNWGIAIIRGKATSASGGTLAVFGSATSRLNEFQFQPDGEVKNLDEQNLGDIGIGNLSNEPIVLADPSKDDFALITQGSAQQVVVAAGVDSQLFQKIINGAGTVDAAAYVIAPELDSDAARSTTRPAQPPQPLIASGDTLFGTFFDQMNFQQTSCQIVIDGAPVQIRGIAGIRPDPTFATDDVAVWTDGGDLVVLDGHVFNGGRSGVPAGTLLCPGGGAPNGVLDPAAIIGTPVATGFTPGVGTLTQILPFGDHFAILQGHDQQTSFLALWDFTAAPGTAGALVGSPLSEPGIRSIALFDDGTATFVVAGFPSAIIDGVTAGKALIYQVDTATGIDAAQIDTLNDAQPDDGQQFGRSVAVMEFNGEPIINVAGNNEVYTYFRTPHLYNTDRRQ